MELAIRKETAPIETDGDGVARVAGTRVTLDTVVTAFLDGATPEEIAQQYPSLDLADLYAVLGYYLRHRRDVDAYLFDRRRESIRIRRENESRFDPKGIRERLLARRREPG